jgi:WD40 repeat protein
MGPVPHDKIDIRYRKVDHGSEKIIPNNVNGDIFVTGQDKLLKRYEIPTDKLDKIQFNKAPAPPVEEFQSHSIGTNCWAVSSNFKFMATGGKDGNVFIRHISNIG